MNNISYEFRAWYKDDFPALLFTDILCPDESRVFHNIEHNITYPFEAPFIDQDWIVDTYTSIDDKEGKKIFTNDILLYNNRYFIIVSEGLMNFNLRYLDDNTLIYPNDIFMKRVILGNSKLVGNKFQNNEMIKSLGE